MGSGFPGEMGIALHCRKFHGASRGSKVKRGDLVKSDDLVKSEMRKTVISETSIDLS